MRLTFVLYFSLKLVLSKNTDEKDILLVFEQQWQKVALCFNMHHYFGAYRLWKFVWWKQRSLSQILADFISLSITYEL